MRKTLLSLTALAALFGAGLTASAQAAPTLTDGATVQTVQFYGPPRGAYWHHEHWREHEWRRHVYWRHHDHGHYWHHW